ncbi:chaplin family protein [Streptomyces sp. NPDC005409]|uniref:chaplin n=1 Tax=Streptomyces sp. NPDC005409 TaxID=3155342 RepID=UPI0034517559
MRQVLSRQVLGKGMLTAAAASSLLSIAAGAAYAHPGASAEASHSPGVLAGNSVSVPVTLAPNVCGNSVDAGAALNPTMGNTCVTTTGAHGDDDHAYERYLSPQNAEALKRYLDEHEEQQGPQERPGPRHAVPEQRHGSPGLEERRQEEPRRDGPRHAKPRVGEERHEGGYGGPGGEERPEEECDDHPGSAPPPPEHHAPPAPDRPHPMPQPVEEHPAPLPAPAPGPQAPVHEAPAPEAPVEEAPAPLPAPVEEAPAPRPPHGSQPVEHPAPAPEVVRPGDQPPAAPAGDVPVHLPPAPAPSAAPAPMPAPAPAPAHVSAPMLAETGAGQSAAAAALATALILGGAILYRRSRVA